MQITTDQLLALLVSKDLEILALKQQIAARDEALKNLAPKEETPA